MEPLILFQEIVKCPAEYARRWKEAHRRPVLAHFCSYAPVEIISAAGLLPFRIFGNSPNPFRADTHLQAYCCHPVRSVLDDALSGRLDFLDGAVFPHTCDSMQRLSDIWRLNIKPAFHADVGLPVKLGTDSANTYMTSLLKQFAADLENFLGVRISENDLIMAARSYNRQRGYIRKLYELKNANPWGIKGSELYAIVKASMIMDVHEWLTRIPGVVAQFSSREKVFPTGKKRVILSGGTCQTPDIYQLIENTGAAVVWDDFCTGTRAVDGDIETDNDMTAAIAQRYMQRAVCPTKHAGFATRGEQLVGMAGKYHADGVIFFLMKFCEPHAFDVPYLKKMLESSGIACQLIEMEGPQGFGEQLKTRCEAFVEMI